MTHRRPRRPRFVAANPIALAMDNARKLTADERGALLRPAQEGVADLRSGRAGITAWRHLADAFNVAEALCELRIAGNLAHELQAAQQALGALMERVHAGHGWAIDATDSRALADGLWLYGVQLEHCSAGEHRRAIEMVRNRISGALAGNAGPGTRVHVTPAPIGPLPLLPQSGERMTFELTAEAETQQDATDAFVEAHGETA